MLDRITPLILTHNEAANIRYTLERLRWARDVVVVDSFSEDATVTILAEFPQTRVFQRRFDSHRNQWNYALTQTGITSEWVLALDADYLLTPEIVEEMRQVQPETGVNGYRAKFVYCVRGRPLRGCAYPPVTVLYRRQRAVYRQDGHTQRVVIDGNVQELRCFILHDDRKPLSQWLRAQDRYTQLELQQLREAQPFQLSFPDHLRKTRWLFPFVIFFYCFFVKRGMLDGWAGVYYAFQRMLAEILLALYLVEDELKAKRKTQPRTAKADNGEQTSKLCAKDPTDSSDPTDQSGSFLT